MRRLYPTYTEDVDLTSAYSYPDVPFGGRWLRANVIESLDGSAIDARGSSRGLAGSADRRLLAALRTLADVILVGATTARREQYRRLRFRPEVIARRQARGLAPEPVVAVVSAGLDFDYRSELFQSEEGRRPLIITIEDAPTLRLATVRELADVVTVGSASVDIANVIDALADRGLTRILCEGGPTLLGQIAAAGLVDELCVTMSPVLAHQPGADPIMRWQRPGPLAPMRLMQVYEEDGFLFLRYASLAPSHGR